MSRLRNRVNPASQQRDLVLRELGASTPKSPTIELAYVTSAHFCVDSFTERDVEVSPWRRSGKSSQALMRHNILSAREESYVIYNECSGMDHHSRRRC